MPDLLVLLLIALAVVGAIGFYLGYVSGQADAAELAILRRDAKHTAGRLTWLESNVWQLWDTLGQRDDQGRDAADWWKDGPQAEGDTDIEPDGPAV